MHKYLLARSLVRYRALLKEPTSAVIVAGASTLYGLCKGKRDVRGCRVVEHASGVRMRDFGIFSLSMYVCYSLECPDIYIYFAPDEPNAKRQPTKCLLQVGVVDGC